MILLKQDENKMVQDAGKFWNNFRHSETLKLHVFRDTLP